MTELVTPKIDRNVVTGEAKQPQHPHKNREVNVVTLSSIAGDATFIEIRGNRKLF